MSLGSYVYDTNGWYQINLFGCYGSSTNIVFYVYQYNTAGTAYITLGGGVALPSTSGTATTISATFQANTTVTYTGQVVFYFQATSVHQSVTFTSANLYVAETQFTGNVLLSYRNGTPIYTLGMDNTGTMVMYTNPTSSVFSGSVSTGYVPYASSANNFANSVMYESGSFIGINNTSPNTYLCVGPNGGVNQSGNIPGISMTSVSGQNMAFSVGQGTAGTNNLLMAWNYNATASSGVGTLSCYGGNNPLVLQESGGNVGIGTLSPAQLLHLYADGARLRIESGTTNNPVLELKTNGNTSYMFTDQSGNLQLYPYTSGKYLLLASNGSFVGIGTTTPGCALDVVGQVRSNSVGNNATITFTSTYGAFGAIESYAYNNVYTKLPVNINAYGGSIGIGRNSTSVCTEEVQTNRVML